MTGDVYEVHYNTFANPQATCESELGRFDSWQKAKEERNRIFMTFPESVRAAWVMRTNPGMNLQPERYGHTMRRDKPQTERKK